MKQETRVPVCCFIVVLGTMTWSLYHPHDLFTWFLESFPVLIALPALAATYKKFKLTDFLYVLLMLHCCVLLVGGHYTYAEVPLFNRLRDTYHLSRNHYDRLGHFFQGFVPALVGRELLLRTSTLGRGKWLAGLLFFGCLGVSALYEIFEYLTSVAIGEQADAFLGTQGDVWDTQEDMMTAGLGAAAALIFFSSVHDRFLRAVKS